MIDGLFDASEQQKKWGKVTRACLGFAVAVISVIALFTSFGLRTELREGREARESQDRCQALLTAQYQVAAARAALAAPGSDERKVWAARLTEVANHLERVDVECYGKPATTTTLPGASPSVTLGPPPG